MNNNEYVFPIENFNVLLNNKCSHINCNKDAIKTNSNSELVCEHHAMNLTAPIKNNKRIGRNTICPTCLLNDITIKFKHCKLHYGYL